MNILKNIFSITDHSNKTHKTITILGVKIKFLIPSKLIIKLLKENNRKISMIDNIWQFKNVKFYVPYYPIDSIQSGIVNNSSFFEQDILEELDDYIPQNATILDIGANIGNHSVYWGKQDKIKGIHSFEPVIDTFNILKKNIEINNLKEKVTIHNVGLSDHKSNADFLTYNRENIGGTQLCEGNGDMILTPLDEIDLNVNKIDFIKVDVENMEILFLKGALNTLKKYKPIIFIESFDENINEVKNILFGMGYKLKKEFIDFNYLFSVDD